MAKPEKTALADIKAYLVSILGEDAVSSATEGEWLNADKLPLFLKNDYGYRPIELFGHPCLLMSAHDEEQTPAGIRKHWEVVSRAFNGDVIYLTQAVAAYDRKRLIEQRVPFLVPGNQLFLPMLGIDLRERFKALRQKSQAAMSASAQAIALREILQGDCSGVPAYRLADLLGYSQMTISRAVKELVDCQLVEVNKNGRTKSPFFLKKGKALWDDVRTLLRNPVRKRVGLVFPGDPYFPRRLSGLSALAHYSDLAEQGVRCFALTSSEFKSLTAMADVEVLNTDPSWKPILFPKQGHQVIAVEVWAYDPGVVSVNPTVVDPLSLWLSFEASKHTNERVYAARERLLETTWSDTAW